MFNTQIMARNVRTNVKKMVNHTIGVGKSLDPGIIVPQLLVSNSTFFNADCGQRSRRINDAF